MRTAAVFALCLLVVAFSAAQDYSKFPAKELAELMQKHEAELIPGKKGVVGKPDAADTLARMPDGHRVLIKALDHYAPIRDELLAKVTKNQATYRELKRREGAGVLPLQAKNALAALEKDRRDLNDAIAICQRSVIGIVERKQGSDQVPDEAMRHFAWFLDPAVRRQCGAIDVFADFGLAARKQDQVCQFLGSCGKRAEAAIPVLRTLTLQGNERAAEALKKVRGD